jgi:ribonuclease R
MERPSVKGITIDDKSTWDIDDAIWVEEGTNGFWVNVSIADVSKVVGVGSSLDKIAEERVGTQYFRTGNSPMLPRLSEHKLSLWPNRPKKTMTVKVFLGPDLTVMSVELFRSVLRSSARLTYDAIPALLGDETSPHVTVLRAAKKLADGLLAKRRANGAMVLYDLNTGWVTTEEGHVRQLVKRADTVGYIIVQELMILANASVAQYASEKNIPVLFRNHEGKETGPDRAELLKQIEDALQTPLADLKFLRLKTHTLLEKAKYEGTLKGHFGLNLPAYLHFTSPIRRYADLVTHQQLRAHLKGEKLPYTVEDFQRIGEYITTKIEEIQKTRSEQAKAKAEHRANRDIELRRLDGLIIPKEFERVTKVQVRSGEDANPNFVKGFMSRLERHEVPLICGALVLVQAPDLENWVCLKHAIVRSLGATPEAAVSLHGIARQSLGWPELIYEVVSEGPPHSPVFKAKAKLMFDEPIEGPEYTAAVSKIAKQCATVALFAQLVGAPIPEFKAAPPPPPTAQPKQPVGPKFDFQKQPISALMEWCQATKTAPPEFAFEQSGPPHMPTITCTIKIAGLTKTTTANSKQDAKALAAAAAIGALSKRIE